MALICSYSLIPLNLLTCREHKGIIVGLGEEGKLTCSYLGTDPTVFTASPSTRRDVSFEVMMHTGPAPAVATTRYKWQSFKWQISCQQKLIGLATEVHFGGDAMRSSSIIAFQITHMCPINCIPHHMQI